MQKIRGVEEDLRNFVILQKIQQSKKKQKEQGKKTLFMFIRKKLKTKTSSTCTFQDTMIEKYWKLIELSSVPW